MENNEEIMENEVNEVSASNYDETDSGWTVLPGCTVRRRILRGYDLYGYQKGPAGCRNGSAPG